MHNSEKEYHESLAQPAMFAHSLPKAVGVVGGGDGGDEGALREVLNHKSVEKAILIKIAEKVRRDGRGQLPGLRAHWRYEVGGGRQPHPI